MVNINQSQGRKLFSVIDALRKKCLNTDQKKLRIWIFFTVMLLTMCEVNHRIT